VVAAFGVAGRVEWRDHLLAELRRFLEHGREKLGSRVGVAGQCGELPDIEQVLEHETNVCQRRVVRRHEAYRWRESVSLTCIRMIDACPTVGRGESVAVMAPPGPPSQKTTQGAGRPNSAH